MNNNKSFYDVNEAKVAGNVTNNLQAKYTSTGKAYLNFSIGSHAGNRTTFVHCIAWNNVAQNLAAQAGKGTKVEILNGRLTHGKKTYTIINRQGQQEQITLRPLEVNVKKFKVLSTAKKTSNRPVQQKQTANTPDFNPFAPKNQTAVPQK